MGRVWGGILCILGSWFGIVVKWRGRGGGLRLGFWGFGGICRGYYLIIIIWLGLVVVRIVCNVVGCDLSRWFLCCVGIIGVIIIV